MDKSSTKEKTNRADDADDACKHDEDDDEDEDDDKGVHSMLMFLTVQIPRGVTLRGLLTGGVADITKNKNGYYKYEKKKPTQKKL